MTQLTRKDSLATLLDAYLAELMEMSDEEVLEGEDPKALEAEGLKMLEAAKVEAGRRRLAIAKSQLAARRLTPSPNPASSSVTAAQARTYLNSVTNDPRFTLAARKLDDLSDDEALRMYWQIQQLRANGSNKG